MSSVLIKNGRIWDGDTFFDGDILCVDSKIAKIAPSIALNADFIFDATGKIVSAGFVDIHVHMRNISPHTIGAQPEMSAFPFGVTAVCDGDGELGSKSLLDSFMVKNVVTVCAEIKNNKADFTHTREMLSKYQEKAIGLKVYFDTEVSDISDEKPLFEAIKFARENSLFLMVHSSNAPISMKALLSLLQPGDILTHAYHGGKNNAMEDSFESLIEAQKRGVIIDTGMAGHVHTNFAIYKEAVACGALPNTISSDITRHSAFKRGGRYGLTMCMSIAKYLGMPEKEIFAAVTTNAARVLGKEDEWGCLKEGRCADIAVIEECNEGFDLTDKANNRIASDKGYRCVLTISNGEVVYRY